MCTVSLVYNSNFPNSFILTSNRDEAVNRGTVPPEIYNEHGVKMLYPRDIVRSGTWIGVSDKKRVLCLLNGGYTAHIRQTPYRMSRGIVVKELLGVRSFEKAVKTYDLNGIEPFTLIAVEWADTLRFIELVWDGVQKHIEKLELKAHLWSSSPLYDNAMKLEREKWFQNFRKNAVMTSQNLWEFHHSGGVGDRQIDIVMDRGFIRTQSITQVVKSEEEFKMIYENLDNKKTTTCIFSY